MSENWSIRRIMMASPCAESDSRCATVAEFFSTNTDIDILPVLEREHIVGIVYRQDFFNIFFQGYGREVFGAKPITALMDAKPLIAESDALVNHLSLWIAENRPEIFQRGFVVTSAQRYLGVVSGLALVRATAEQLGETVSALQKTQQSLIESEKLASLGGLVAGVSHEINTPVGIALTAVSSFASDLKHFNALRAEARVKRSDLDIFIESAQAATQFIEMNLARTRDLVRSFKNIAVDQVSDQRRSFVVRPYLDEILTSLRPQLKKFPHRVQISCPDTLTVEGYPGALAQIVTNLVVNAVVHAFADETVGNISLDVTLSTPDFWILKVTDDGIGMSADTASQIFEPFFTTKRGRGGTGLGLSITYNLVRQRMGGEIAVTSQPGVGTCLTLRFPLIAPEAS